MKESIVLARFGGGQNFSSPSVNSFSSPSFGSGGFFFLPFFSGGLGTLIVIVFVLAIIYSYYKRYTGNFTSSVQTQSIPKTDLTPIMNMDPQFSEQRFLDHVQALFFRFQEAWSMGELTAVQPFLTQSMYTRIKIQLDELNSKNEQDVLQDISIGGMRIVKATIDENYEYFVVQIDASMKDYEIDKGSKKVIEGNQYTQKPFTEYWEFIRSKAVQSNYTKGFVAQTCPNCGAPIEINEFGQCKYCKAAITSGNFDWVLDNIYQEGEFNI